MVVFDKLWEGKIQKDLFDRQSRLSGIAANDAQRRGREAERNFREGVGLSIDAVRNRAAGGNVDLGTGTAGEVQADMQRVAELDAIQIRNNAAREAWGLRTQARFQRYQGDLAIVRSRQAAFNDVLGLVTSAASAGAGGAGGGGA
jgi:hypothetical protein